MTGLLVVCPDGPQAATSRNKPGLFDHISFGEEHRAIFSLVGHCQVVLHVISAQTGKRDSAPICILDLDHKTKRIRDLRHKQRKSSVFCCIAEG